MILVFSDNTWEFCFKVMNETEAILKVKNPEEIMADLNKANLVKNDLMNFEFNARESAVEKKLYLRELIPRIGPEALDILIENLGRTKQNNAQGDFLRAKRDLEDSLKEESHCNQLGMSVNLTQSVPSLGVTLKT